MIDERICGACGARYEVFVRGDQQWNLDSADHKGCTCGEVARYRRVVGVPRPINGGDEAGVGRHYPRFDRGLNMYIRSHAHRKAICKARNLIPIEGDFDVERAHRRADEKRAAGELARKRSEERWKHDAGAKAIKIASESGQLQEMAAQSVAEAGIRNRDGSAPKIQLRE